MKKEKKEIKKLREGDELLFQLGERQIVEKVKVESIDKKGGFVVLSNRVKVARSLGPDDTYARLDGKDGKILPLTEENEKYFQAFKAYFSIKRNSEILDKGLRNMSKEEQVEVLIEFDKKFTKIVNKYFNKEKQ
jgi:hypothetical protein